MDNFTLMQSTPVALTRAEDGKMVPAWPLGDDFYLSIEFLREHGDQVLTLHGTMDQPLWQAGFVNNNAEALRLYFQLANVPDDVSQWTQTLYKAGQYYYYKIFDARGREVYRRLELDIPGLDPVFLTALSIVTAGAASAIGAAVLGAEAAATYPALATMIGQVAINTVASGGDIKNAVKSAVIGQIAGQVGQYAGAQVQALTDVDLLAKSTAGAVSSAIRGGNIVLGALQPGLYAVGNSIAESVGNAFSTLNGGDMDYGFGDDGYTFDDSFQLDMPVVPWSQDPIKVDSFSSFDSFDSFDAGNLDDLSFSGDASFGGADYVYTFGDVSSNYHDPVYDADPDYTPIFGGVTPQLPDGGGEISIPDPSIYLPDYQVTGGSNIPTTQGGTDWGAALAKLGTMALQIYQQQRSPAIKSATTSVRLPDGSIQVVNRNGTVTTRSPSGQTTTTQLPPGQPYRFPDGSIVMNNGNGSYTEQNMAGQISTRQYGGASLGGVSLPILAGGALLLFLALKK